MIDTCLESKIPDSGLRCCAQEIANTLWAFATLEHNPGSGMLDAAAAQIARRIEQFSPQVPLSCLARLSTCHKEDSENHWHVFWWSAELPLCLLTHTVKTIDMPYGAWQGPLCCH